MNTILHIARIALACALMAACSMQPDEPGAAEEVFNLDQDIGVARRVNVPTFAEPRVIVDLDWGSGGWKVGRFDGDQAASAGPMSFALSAAGEIFLLDQINAGILVFAPDGSPNRKIALPSKTFLDILVLDSGAMVLLDRDVRGVIVIMDERGAVLGEHAVEGPGIERAGRVTATYALDDGIWLEYHHETMVHVLDAGLSPCARTILPGLPHGAGGARIRPARIEAGGAIVRMEDASGSIIREKKIYLDHGIERIAWTDTDGRGNIYAILHLLEYDGRVPPSVAHEETVGMVFDRNLDLLAKIVSPYAITEWWQFKEFEVTPDGRILQLAVTQQGARLLEWGASW
ncbi:MAG: hypothetical protein ABIJ56_10270 [Pseudomonadota bacterium]